MPSRAGLDRLDRLSHLLFPLIDILGPCGGGVELELVVAPVGVDASRASCGSKGTAPASAPESASQQISSFTIALSGLSVESFVTCPQISPPWTVIAMTP